MADEGFICFLLVILVVEIGFMLKWMAGISGKLDSLRKPEKHESGLLPQSERCSAEITPEKAVKPKPEIVLPPQPEPIAVRTEKPEPPVPPSPAPEKIVVPPMEFLPEWITDWFFVRGKYRKEGMSPEFAAASVWLIRIGVLVLLFGMGFLAKYLIEHSLFPPALRVAGMFLLGVILFAVGVRLARSKYSTVALGIIGLGFATGYLSIFLGSRLYGLIGVPWAFAAMVLLTAFCMYFSVRRDYLFPVLVGVLGGYLTPFLLDTKGFAPEWQLGYITVITAGVLFCAFFRSWRFLNWLALVFDFLSLAVVTDRFFEPARKIFQFGIIDQNIFQSFILLNFMLFALLPAVRVLVRKTRLELPEILIHCGAHGALFLLTLFRFMHWIPEFTLRYILCFAALTALVQLPLMKTADRTDPNWKILQLVFLAGALLFLVPVQFTALAIVIGWMVLALILLTLGIILNSVSLTVGSLIFAVISGWKILIMDLGIKSFYAKLPYFSGLESRLAGIGAFIAGLLLAAGLMKWLGKRYPAIFERNMFLKPVPFCAVGLSLFFIYSSVELSWMLEAYLNVFRNGGLSLWWGLWAILLLTYGILAGERIPRLLSLILFAVCTVKIFLYDLSSLHALYKVAAFVVLGLLMLGGAVLYTRFKDRIFRA